MSDPRELVPRNGSEKYVRILKLLQLSTTILHKLLKASLCCAHGNAEVERFPFNKQKLSTKNVLCCQMSQTNKDAVSPCYANHSSLDTDKQSGLQCIQQPKNTRREREKAKEWRLKDRREQQGPSCLWRGKSESKRTEKNLSVRNKRSARKSCRWLGGSTLRESHKKQNRRLGGGGN